MQAPASIFNPLNHLINPQKLQQYECMICMEKSIRILKCTTCRKYFCNQCAKDQRVKLKTCPQRCSPNQFNFQIVPVQLEYRCPFSTECKVIMRSVKQFNEHDQECKCINNEQRKQCNRRRQFKCKNDHTLQIYIDTYEALMKRKKCSQCELQMTSRAICRNCDNNFCSNCRPIPIFNMKCPIGHQFRSRKFITTNYNCDLCQLSPAILGIDLYDDFICNFGICKNCFINYPTFLKPIEYVENLQLHCQMAGKIAITSQMNTEQKQSFQKQHQLTFLPQEIEAKCDWCEKVKNCYKKCMKCQKYYCKNCKIFQIMPNFECEFQHPFKFFEFHPQEQGVGKCPEKCWQCGISHNQSNILELSFLKDEQCKVILCEKCFNRIFKFNLETGYKQVSSDVRECICDSHPLFYQPSKELVTQLCSSCNVVKPIKFLCIMCKQSKLYCCACVPAKDHKKCYCGKELTQLQNPQNYQCLVCLKYEGQKFGCRFCSYYICQSCYEEGFNSTKEETEEKYIKQ